MTRSVMSRIVSVIALALFCVAPACGQTGDDIMNKLVNAPSAKSWKASGFSSWPEEISDPAVTGGVALRFNVPQKGKNPWSYSADVNIFKPVNAGDVVLVAFWARAAEPMEGRSTAFIDAIRVQELKAPYGAFVQDQVEVGSKWTMLYASGTADKDYKPGSIKLSVFLGAGKQSIELGPVFVLDFGPDYDHAKLPHNKPVAVAPAPAAAPLPAPTPVGPAPVSNAQGEAAFAVELAKLRADLPVKGALVNDPSIYTVGSYGTGQSMAVIDAGGVPGGKAVRVEVTADGGASYALGTTSPLSGSIRKGDTVLIAAYVRCAAGSGRIASLRVQRNTSPWTMAADGPVTAGPEWKLVRIAAVASEDLPVGAGMLSAQFGGAKQILEFGPVFVLNLGPGIVPGSLTKS